MDVHLNPRIVPDWMLPGQRREVVTQGNNRKQYVAGALEARTVRLTWVKGQRKTSALFIDLVRAVAAAYPQAKRLHFILDNAATHSSKVKQKALAALDGRIVLHFLPPYGPEGNRIERVWWDVHADVTRNHRCKKMEALMGEVDAYLEARNAQATSSPVLRTRPRSITPARYTDASWTWQQPHPAAQRSWRHARGRSWKPQTSTRMPAARWMLPTVLASRAHGRQALTGPSHRQGVATGCTGELARVSWTACPP
ncbi:MAG: IS630 family transposase [Myxococcaceae bacterium]|nr:MAG: IS630 family transposase [Myxococcaceae bacterium]